jgi:hypothetical protein
MTPTGQVEVVWLHVGGHVELVKVEARKDPGSGGAPIVDELIGGEVEWIRPQNPDFMGVTLGVNAELGLDDTARRNVIASELADEHLVGDAVVWDVLMGRKVRPELFERLMKPRRQKRVRS